MLDEHWKGTYRGFLQRVIPGALSAAGASGPVAADVIARLAAPIFTFQRLAGAHLPSGGSATLEIDAGAVTERFHTATFEVNGSSFPAEQLIRPIVEGSRKTLFPNAPLVPQGGVRVLQDEESPLIQVADLFGNFLSARVFLALGRTSSTLAEKALAFDEVFGDAAQQIQTSDLQLVGSNDFRLNSAGAFKLIVWQG